MSDKIVFVKTSKGNFFRYKDMYYVVSEKSIMEFKSRLTLPFIAKFIGYSNSDVIKIVYALYDRDIKVSIKMLNKNNLHYIAYFSKIKDLIISRV